MNNIHLYVSTFTPEELEQMVRPSRSALLIVDVQNDFCHPDGMNGKRGTDLSGIDPAVDNLEILHQSAREAGVPVIFLRVDKKEEYQVSPAVRTLRERKGRPTSWESEVCRSQTTGADYYRLRPQSGDIEVVKDRFSSFIGTNLELILKSLNVDTLVVGGVSTECSVESTVRHGLMLDYHMFVPYDACAAFDEISHAASLRVMANIFSIVVPSAQIVASWSVDQRAT